ncbi:mannitol dehydrogenase family protein [Shewanella electrodiphila]|uniref:Mannitol dehydrogenase family protein n=1 Tax=Shewanella electrodiphila TaxID=934143 RepID=A0ABT0KSL4_9GAMM|nr:mannitol dehydrogenase family protein [Shewanella electrodiphila]MCL1046748.1 mannitol dehydrogenase family protein [Shewanella electrodiphila]
MSKLTQTNSSAILLNQKNLCSLPHNVKIPSYDRSKLSAGIVHIGVGGFHRAHQAMYIDTLLQQPGSEQWGICGIGLLEGNRSLAEILKKQDYLYSLIVRHPDGKVENQVIGSLIDFIFAPDDKQAVINKLASEQTQIVSLTITEGGYNFNPATGEFDLSNPDILHDIANLNSPNTTFGYLTVALKIRMQQDIAPFSIQSCDNIQHNGAVTKKMLLAFIEQCDNELYAWVNENVSFPNGMVDRITPVTTANDIQYLAEDIGVVDEWPITCEAFTQWVIEDDFCNGRPNWNLAGAQFVTDVTPYEKMKIRLLNAGHSVLGLLGSIHGFDTIDESVNDPLFAEYLRVFMDKEVTPLLEQLEGIDLTQYKDTLIERFSNPNIKDSLSRICLESSAKLPKFLIATIMENIAKNPTQPNIEFATLVIAAWCYYSDKQVNQNGQSLDIQDQMATTLNQHASKTESNPLAFLDITELFGDLNNQPEFCKIYKNSIEAVYDNQLSIKTVMQQVIDSKGL